MVRYGLLWLALVVGCAANGPAPPPPPPTPDLSPPPPLQPAIQLSLSELALENGAISTSFNFGQLRTLWVRVLVPSMTQVSGLHLVFTNPRNEPFYETTRQYTTDPKIDTMMMPGMDHPTSIFAAKQVPGGWALDAPIPVVGSVLSRYPAVGVGHWTIRATAEGYPNPIDTSMDVTFER